MATTKLALGSGGATGYYKTHGYITLDADPACGADWTCAIPPLPDLGPLEYVEAYHFWEHLYLWQAEELAVQIYLALIPGGKLVLEMPDLAKCCRFLLGLDQLPVKDNAPYHPDPRFTMWGIYGAQDDPKWTENIWQTHKWGYTPETIKTQLQVAGFRDVTIKAPLTGQPERDMRVEAVR